MLEGYTSIPIEHFGGLVTAWPAAMLDVSLLVEAANLRFTQAAVSNREGLTLAFATPSGNAVRGVMDYVHADGTEQPLVLDAAGTLYAESPAGSGTLARATLSPFTIPPGAWANGISAFGRVYMAFGDGKSGVGSPASFDGTNLDPVTIAGPPVTAVAPADAASTGNIAAGQRFVQVFFQTREGSFSPAGSAIGQWTAAGGKQVTVSEIPLGPTAQVAARVVAFTVAGGSSDGPYFYIPEAQTVNGVIETATIIADNSTTNATFNFDDDFLAASEDASDQFRAITLPDVAGVVFSQTTQRMLWWGDPAQPNTVYCSQPSDAGLYLGDTGFFQVAQGGGRRVTSVFEFRNQIYVALEDGLYLVTPNGGDPATWNIQQISPLAGAAGVRAVAIGNDFAILVHRTGVYTFDGGSPVLVSNEILGRAADAPGLWERIHWALDWQVWADIDHEQQCVRIGVPLDRATACSHILKASYLDGWDESLRFSPFTARYHYFPGRRWSLDEIAASQAVRVRRPQPDGAMAADRRLSQSQVLLASSGPNGAVDFVDASAATDNGIPFQWTLQTGAVSAAEALKQQRQGMEMIGVVQARATGQGQVVVETVADGGEAKLAGTIALDGASTAAQSLLALAQGDAVGLRVSNLPSQGTRMELLALYAFARPSWTINPNR